MVSVRSALCGALAAVAVGAAPAHALDDPVTARTGTVEIIPVTTKPGADVRVRVAGCTGDRATAVSEAFVTDAKLTRDTTGHVAEATVRSTTTAGTYPVKISCDGRDGVAEGQLIIVPDAGAASLTEGRDGRDGHDGHDGRGHEGLDGHGTLAGADHDHDHGVPVAPVPAGGGGTAPLAASGSPGTPGLVVGGVGVAIAGGLIWYRRRTEAGRR
ncbi:hypothetical protein [Streptomyces sp. I05A-00742]|uniref:hypothetical protein n=1 Tax=Streptomyces sp. I05A-00742 TaxID=2732853 RepID=UPI001488ED47|nr:hypothetical protein [Streptomyces sp. I05A-00742]